MPSGMRGHKEMAFKIEQVARANPEKVARAEYFEAQIEATEMKRRTPVDITLDAPHPGNLRNSIHVEDPEINGRRISVTIATGAQAPYGIYVHENPDAFHPIGQWKFMESVLDESAPFMAFRLARHLKWDK